MKSLLDVGRVEPSIGRQLWWTWGLFAGAELEPLVGTFFVFGAEVRFGWTLGAGLGGGGTSLQLPQAPQFSPTGPQRSGQRWRDAGPRFMGTISTGLRVVIGRYLVLRTEVRDVMYGSHISTLDGCPVGAADSSCGVVLPSESPALPKTSLERQRNEVIVNIGAYVGAGVMF